MEYEKRKILGWELAGIVVIFFAGAGLHFLFEWSNYWRPMAVFAAVNESTWEHFKMGFWPGLAFALVEFRFIKDVANNFIFAKFVSLLIMPVGITLLFYGYTFLSGSHFLLADVLVFFISIIVGQLVSYRIMTIPKMGAQFRRLGAVGLLAMVAAFSLLSYFPPHIFLFQHPQSGEYGILTSYETHEHDEAGAADHDE